MRGRPVEERTDPGVPLQDERLECLTASSARGGRMSHCMTGSRPIPEIVGMAGA